LAEVFVMDPKLREWARLSDALMESVAKALANAA
jgi:hypothetical protein